MKLNELVYGESVEALVPGLLAIASNMERGSDGLFHARVQLDADRSNPLRRALMRVEAELLREDADAIGTALEEERSYEERAADALLSFVGKTWASTAAVSSTRGRRTLAVTQDIPANSPVRTPVSALEGIHTPNLLIGSWVDGVRCTGWYSRRGSRLVCQLEGDTCGDGVVEGATQLPLQVAVDRIAPE